MRGAQRSAVGRSIPRGIIPAYAGSTFELAVCKHGVKDHPRVCGEHRCVIVKQRLCPGSSPRMRGAPAMSIGIDAALGIIPAYAGSTGHRGHHDHGGRDHPRVCGEHLTYNQRAAEIMGSSPRMRGAPPRAVHVGKTAGIIPAYAGSTNGVRHYKLCKWDHPRVCGEHYADDISESVKSGSSPRMRGAQDGG